MFAAEIARTLTSNILPFSVGMVNRMAVSSRFSLRFGWIFCAGLIGAAVLPAFFADSHGTIADAPKQPAEYECRWTDAPPTIDGAADEAAWKQAQIIDKFSVPLDGGKSRPARTGTKARLLWDRENLYFFAEMEDADLFADVKEHDGVTWDNDVFELFFQPDAKKPGYYEFQVNALGTIMDMYLPRRGAGGYRRFKSDGDFHLEAKVRLRGTLNHWEDKDEGWSVEGRIPWRDFHRTGGRPAADDRWKFALCRYDFSVAFEGPDTSTCAPLSVPDFHHHEDYVVLRFLGR